MKNQQFYHTVQGILPKTHTLETRTRQDHCNTHVLQNELKQAKHNTYVVHVKIIEGPSSEDRVKLEANQVYRGIILISS